MDAWLDVGGAKGHLSGILRRRRPDLDIVVNDVSRFACEWARSHYGLKTICGPIGALDERDGKFDVVIMSDVIYYESELNNLWRVLPDLLNEGGKSAPTGAEQVAANSCGVLVNRPNLVSAETGAAGSNPRGSVFRWTEHAKSGIMSNEDFT
ncbi:MAG: class I SAM-dependent methyltransferase [Nitrososphaera sp.]|nr:class I SAM-dependent methyltransferase [Nitrososphaera sp.]